MKLPEILAPCGSFEHVQAALGAGADAVYLGGLRFSARQKAKNFDPIDMVEALKLTHLHGVRLYVTVNTLIKEKEWEDACSYLDELVALGVDAIIVQDVGLAYALRTRYPDLELHASTQMSVHSSDGVAFLKSMGFSRVILARECDQEQIRLIRSNHPDMELECFVHGALCVSVSGQCLLSSSLGTRSGNRGTCAQPCRLNTRTGNQEYALSLKDLSLIDKLPQLQELGISSFKIEGRLKTPQYVYAVVRACKESLNGQKTNLSELEAIFSRNGFTQGYFSGNHENMTGIHTSQDPPSLPIAPVPDIPVEAEFTLAESTEASLTLQAKGVQVSVKGPIPEIARVTALDENTARSRIGRMGQTPFALSHTICHIDEGLTLSASALNEMRRLACDELIAQLSHRPVPGQKAPWPVTQWDHHAKKGTLRIICYTSEQLQAGAELADIVILPPKLVLEGLARLGPERVFVMAPRWDSELSPLKTLYENGARHLLCDSLAHIHQGVQLGFRLHGGPFLHVTNGISASALQAQGLEDATYSLELSMREALAIQAPLPLGWEGAGATPMMLLRRCPFSEVCKKGKKCPEDLTDRAGRNLRILCHGAYRELLNPDILWLGDLLPASAPFVTLRMSTESGTATKRLIQAFSAHEESPVSPFTRGCYRRGVD
jgi:putative protease